MTKIESKPRPELDTDSVDRHDGMGTAYCVASVELGCTECHEIAHRFRIICSWFTQTAALECPNCDAEVVEWAS